MIIKIKMIIDLTCLLSKRGPLADHLRHTKIQTYNYLECRQKYTTAVGDEAVEINENMVSGDI